MPVLLRGTFRYRIDEGETTGALASSFKYEKSSKIVSLKLR